MKQLLLLATEQVEESKHYLYALELKYQKVIKIVKMETADVLKDNWRVGSITGVDNISKWTLDDTLYITSKEKLQNEYEFLTKIMLDKASFPDTLIYPISGISEGILRLCNLKVLDNGKMIEFMVWGTDCKKTAVVSDPWWKNYWANKYSKEHREKYERFFAVSKRKVFGIVERKQDLLDIKKIIVK